jgi:DNA-binding MarR family transcriptional regulator
MEDPDLAVLVTGAARIVADRLVAAVEHAGVLDMRASFGFVIRALAARDLTLTELAELLAVTKQAAIKVVDQMEERGYLERCANPADRRAKVLRLTPKAEKVRRAAMSASRRIENELREDLGAEAVAAMRHALLRLLERHGALTDAVAGRSRAVW